MGYTEEKIYQDALKKRNVCKCLSVKHGCYKCNYDNLLLRIDKK